MHKLYKKVDGLYKYLDTYDSMISTSSTSFSAIRGMATSLYRINMVKKNLNPAQNIFFIVRSNFYTINQNRAYFNNYSDGTEYMVEKIECEYLYDIDDLLYFTN